MSNEPERRKLAPMPGLPEVDAVKVEVEVAREPLSEYILSDGTLLRLKSSIIEVWRFESMYDAEGNPLYQTRAATVQTVSVNDPKLKKQAQ